jgi:hypothetical protein
MPAAGPDFDRQHALAVHGVARVDRHVDDCRIELPAIGAGEDRLVRQLQHQLHARSAQRLNDPATSRRLSQASNSSGVSACRRAKASNCPVSLAARSAVDPIASI